MVRSTLAAEGKLYKGNLHLHTTRSDGKLSPKATIDRYKSRGYAFCAITDHWLYSWYPEFETEDFLMLSGTELGSDITNSGAGVHHVVAFADPSRNTYPLDTAFDAEDMKHWPLQRVVDDILDHGNEALYCHPYWSLVEPSDIAGLSGVLGMEIYNHAAEIEGRMGSGEAFYDHLLWRGEKPWAFSTDDAHGKLPDYCGGYVMVKTKNFTHAGLLQALREGSFYACASMEGEEAPEIVSFTLEDGSAKLTCSPAKRVHFLVREALYPAMWPASYTGSVRGDTPLTCAEMHISPTARSVRAVVVDERGNTSWTQPIFL